MSVPPIMLDLRARLGGLPLDKAPLRRAGLLSVLLVILLVVGKAFGPGRAAASAPGARQDVQGATEQVSAPRPVAGWTGGRVLALGLLAAGAAGALVLHRRRGPAARRAASALDVLETHPLGPGQSLRLVACGEEVLLLSVGAEGARLLRHWPRDRFDRDAVSFADALAEAAGEGLTEERGTGNEEWAAIPDTDRSLMDTPLPVGEGHPTGRRSQGEEWAVDALASPAPVVGSPEAAGASVVAVAPPVVRDGPPATRGVLFPAAPARGLHQFGSV